MYYCNLIKKLCLPLLQKQPLGVFYKKRIFKNFAKSTKKHLYQSLMFNKVASLRLETLTEKRLWHRCFPINIAKSSKTPSLQNTSGRLLLSSGIFMKALNMFCWLQKVLRQLVLASTLLKISKSICRSIL